jgi:predicted TIM-barrel fold metal-dependent hydrolase
MLIIDGHIHAGYWSPKMFLGRGSSFEAMEQCLIECGIDGAILTSTDRRDNASVAAFIAGETKRKYWFFPWLNPGVEADIDYARRNAGGIDGIKLHPSCDRIRVDDPRTQPLLQLAQDHGLAVMVHCGRWQEMSSYLFALDVAAKYPAIRFVLSHMGGDTPELEMGTIEGIAQGGLDNVLLGIEGVREYWAVQEAVDDLGADRVLFGSDFPLGHPRMYMGVVDALRITAEQKDLIMGGNALRLVGEV